MTTYATFEPSLKNVTGPTTAGIQFFYLEDQEGNRIWQGGDVNGSIGAYSAEIENGEVKYLELRSHNEYEPATYGWTPRDQINPTSPDLSSSTYWYGNDLTIAQMSSGEEIAFKFKRIDNDVVKFHPVYIHGKFGDNESTMLVNAKTTGSHLKDNMVNTYGANDPYIKFVVDLSVTLGGEEESSQSQLLEEMQEKENVQIGENVVIPSSDITKEDVTEEISTSEGSSSPPVSSSSVEITNKKQATTQTGTATNQENTQEEDTGNMVITLLGLNVDVTMGMKAETLAFPSVSEIYNLPVGAIKVSTEDFRRAFQFKPTAGTGPSDMETSGMKFRFNRNARYPNSVMTTLTKNNPMKAVFPTSSEVFSDVGNVVYPQLTANQGEDTTEQPRVPYEYRELENTIPHDYVKCVAHQCFGSPANYVTFENLGTLYGTLESNSIGPMNEVWANCKSPAAGTPGLDSSTGIYAYNSGLTGDAVVLQYPTLISNWMYNQIKAQKGDRLVKYEGVPDEDGFYEMPLMKGDVISFKMTVNPAHDQHTATSVFSDDDSGKRQCKLATSRAYEILYYLE